MKDRFMQTDNPLAFSVTGKMLCNTISETINKSNFEFKQPMPPDNINHHFMCFFSDKFKKAVCSNRR